MAIRDFIHGVVDVICDFFLAAWDTVVDLVKTAVRFIGRAYDFFQKLLKKTWNAIKAGTHKIYIIIFRPKNITPESTKGEIELMNLFGNVVKTAEENGEVGVVPFFAVSMNNNTMSVEEYNSFNMGRDVEDPVMRNVIKTANREKRAVNVVGLV